MRSYLSFAHDVNHSAPEQIQEPRPRLGCYDAPNQKCRGEIFWVRESDGENRKKNVTQLTFAVLALSSWGARKYVHNGIKNAQSLLIKHTSKTLIQKDAMHPNSRHAYQKARVMLRQRRLSEAKSARQRQRSAKGTYCLLYTSPSPRDS